MKDTPPMAGNLMPPAQKKPTLSSNNISNQTAPQEQQMEGILSNQDKSPPKKKKTPSETATLDSANSFKTTAASEIKMLVTKFAEEFSERAAADTFQMKELEGILIEARNLESSLKEKKNHLRQTLALISDKLQS